MQGEKSDTAAVQKRKATKAVGSMKPPRPPADAGEAADSLRRLWLAAPPPMRRRTKSESMALTSACAGFA